MKKPNVCFIIEKTTDIRFINGLKDYFNVTILARKRKDYTIVPWQISDEVKTRIFRCNRLLYPLVLFIWIIKNGFGFDVFIVNSDTLAGVSVNLAKYFLQKPMVAIIQKPTIEYLYARYCKGHIGAIQYFLLHNIIRLLIMWNIYHFDLSIVVSCYIKSKLSRYSKREIKVIPLYGIDNVFKPLPSDKKRELREKLNIPLGKYVIFISSRISPEKGIYSFLKAMKLLIKEGIKDIILLNLSGQYKDFVKLAQKFALKEFIISRPAIIPYNLPPYYQSVDLCIQPSLYEGLGLSPLEALACGTPVIVSHAGGLKESTIHMVHSLHFKPGDAEDLAEKIRYAYYHRKKMKQMAEVGKRWVREKYDSKMVFNKLETAVKQLLK